MLKSSDPLAPQHRTLAHKVSTGLQEVQQACSSGQSGDEQRSSQVKFSALVRQSLVEEREDSEQVGFECAVWQLMELFCLHAPMSEGVITEDMVEWLRDNTGPLYNGFLNLPTTLQNQAHSIQNASSVTSSSEFWEMVCCFVAIGQIDEALVCIESLDVIRLPLQPPAKDLAPQLDLLDTLCVLLRSMPTFCRANGESSTGRSFSNAHEFAQFRAQWLARCAGLPPRKVTECRKQCPATAEGVCRVLSLLICNDPQVLVQYCSHWLELLVANLVHVKPGMRATAVLPKLLPQCLQSIPEQNTAGMVIYELLEALVAMEVQEVVCILSVSLLVSPWFLAHMYPLLHAYPSNSAIIRRAVPLFGGDQEELYTLLFVDSLAVQRSSWKLTLQQLAWCPTHGSQAAQALLKRVTVSGGCGRNLHQALRVCRQHGLSSAAASLLRTAAADATYEGRTGDATALLLAAQDDGRLALVLQPAVDVAAAGIFRHIGSYSLGHGGGSGSGAGGGAATQGAELSLLLKDISGASGASCPAAVAVLRSLLQLQEATANAATLLDSSVPISHADLLAQYSSACCALMELASAPRSHISANLALAILFSSIPLLEASHASLLPADVQALTAWLNRCCEESAMLSHGGCPVGVGSVHRVAGGGGGSVGEEVLHERQVQDVRLALARALVKAHVRVASAPAVAGQ
ncbi:MAG: hypothetical protein WDW36_001687 [Sanguina aurantia]